MGGFDSPTPDHFNVGIILDFTIRPKPKSIKLTKKRWSLIIEIDYEDGTREEFVASADNMYTEGSGLWFGTKDEWQEIENDF